MSQLPPGSWSFNCLNLTQEHATTQKKHIPLTLTQTLTKTPNTNLMLTSALTQQNPNPRGT